LENHRPGYIIFFSSVDVYGLVPPNTKVSENLPAAPTNYYGISKLASELLLKNACSKHNVPLLIMRLSGAYGADDEAGSTIGKMIASARKGEITIFGDGKDLRDFVYIEDISRLIKEAVARKISGTFNIATGISHTITGIAETIRENAKSVGSGAGLGAGSDTGSGSGLDFSIRYVPQSTTPAARSKEMVYDITLFRKAFPDFKFTSMHEGIAQYINQSKAQGKGMPEQR
jgi:nucleoside-diphosphate-sugar epimerase